MSVVIAIVNVLLKPCYSLSCSYAMCRSTPRKHLVLLCGRLSAGVTHHGLHRKEYAWIPLAEHLFMTQMSEFILLSTSALHSLNPCCSGDLNDVCPLSTA